MKRTEQCIVLAGILIAAVMILSLLVAAPAHAERPLTPGNDLQVRIVTIKDKAGGYNFIFVDERQFRVSTTATIVNRAGRKIGLADLRVPCKAEITYHLFGDSRHPLVEKIQVK